MSESRPPLEALRDLNVDLFRIDCPMCQTEMQLFHSISFAHNRVREHASCPNCKFQLEERSHSLN